MKNKCFWALIFWFSLVPWAFSQKVTPVNPGQVERTARQLTNVLKAKGFEVKQGYFKLWAIDDCQFTYDRLGLCLGNNPAAPYIVPTVPPWPDEAVIPNHDCVFGPCHPGTEDIYRLDPREAIIILAETPPPARYYSEQSWVFSRQGSYDTESDTYKAIAKATEEGELPPFILPIFFRTIPNLPAGIPQRIFLIASMDKNPNSFVIQNQTNTTPFNQQRYFIITPDAYMDTAVRDALKSISVGETDIFTEKIPSASGVGSDSKLRIGLDQASDDFMTFIRYAQPDDGGGPGTASYRWRKNLPLAVLRVRATDHEAQPYPAFTMDDLETRTAFDEKTTFQSDLNSLVSAISNKWDHPCTESDCSDQGAVSLINVQTPPLSMVGPLCTPVGENCLGDNWDASYALYGRMSLDAGEIYAVAGTLGTRTGNATYVGLGINKASQFVGVANLSDKNLQDTAQTFVAKLTGNNCPATGHTGTADCMFVYYFARDCSVVEAVTGESNCFTINTKLIPEGDSLVLTLRDYVRPGTERGPDSSKVLPPVLIRVR
ncbi:MAG TPA: hypothetical protein VJ955_08525 [Desulfuromonadales bacterium]|nr:hypothetical protein [Desulfuromonadales bacterium]